MGTGRRPRRAIGHVSAGRGVGRTRSPAPGARRSPPKPGAARCSARRRLHRMHDRDRQRVRGRVCASGLFIERRNSTDARPIRPPGAVREPARATWSVRACIHRRPVLHSCAKRTDLKRRPRNCEAPAPGPCQALGRGVAKSAGTSSSIEPPVSRTANRSSGRGGGPEITVPSIRKKPLWHRQAKLAWSVQS